VGLAGEVGWPGCLDRGMGKCVCAVLSCGDGTRWLDDIVAAVGGGGGSGSGSGGWRLELASFWTASTAMDAFSV